MHNHTVYLSVVGHLSFYFLALMINAAVNVDVHLHSCFQFFGIYT